MILYLNFDVRRLWVNMNNFVDVNTRNSWSIWRWSRRLGVFLFLLKRFNIWKISKIVFYSNRIIIGKLFLLSLLAGPKNGASIGLLFRQAPPFLSKEIIKDRTSSSVSIVAAFTIFDLRLVLTTIESLSSFPDVTEQKLPHRPVFFVFRSVRILVNISSNSFFGMCCEYQENSRWQFNCGRKFFSQKP